MGETCASDIRPAVLTLAQLERDIMAKRPHSAIMALRRAGSVWQWHGGLGSVPKPGCIVFSRHVAGELIDRARVRQIGSVGPRGAGEKPASEELQHVCGLLPSLRTPIRRVLCALARSYYPNHGMDLTKHFLGAWCDLLLCRFLQLPPSDIDAVKDAMLVLKDGAGSVGWGDPDSLSLYASQIACAVEHEGVAESALPFLRAWCASGGGDVGTLWLYLAKLLIRSCDTANMIVAVTVSYLLEAGQWWTTVRDYPAIVPAIACEEARNEPPVASVIQQACADIELAGKLFPHGSFIITSLLGVLRDPDATESPDELRIGRCDENGPFHQAAIGVREDERLLAQLLAEEAICALAAELPGLRPAGSPVRVEGLFGLRRLVGYEVQW